MRTFAERFYSALENQLTEVAINEKSSADQYRTSILLCKKAMAKLKNYISSYAFENTEEEIHFFKNVKPQFYSKYIYFINVYNFLIQQPLGGNEILKEYINFQLADVKRYFDHNQAFYQYYRSGSTQMDEAYFTRGGFDVLSELEDFEEDEVYSTSYDYKLSKIMANEQFQNFLNMELSKTLHHKDPVTEGAIDLPFTWTASKTDLVELIYALVALGVFNSGNIEIKALMNFFQTILHVDLGSYYHKYADISRRKKERTSFLDKLKLALLRKIEDKFDAAGSQQHTIRF